MNDLTEEDKKLLAEYMGECRHEIVEVFGNRFAPARAIAKCIKCGWTYARNRTFDNWQDTGDLKEKIEEKEDWDSFEAVAIDKWYEDSDRQTDYTLWLMNKDCFPRLMVAWLKQRKEREK